MSIERARLTAARWVSCCLALALSACAGTDRGADLEVAAIAEDEQRASAVYVLETGHWSQYVYHGITRESFWVDLAVRNDAYAKEVGILWTTDRWITSQRAIAVYEGTLPDGRERWGVDVRDFATRGWGREPEVEFAAFVAMNGQTHWSPFRNHYVYRGVTSSSPVRLLSSRIAWDGSVASLEGTVRSLRTARPRRIFVRYTLDGWATWSEAEATPSEGEHAFAIPLAIDPARTEEVIFAIRLELDGESAWDNNAGADHRHPLAPVVHASFVNAPSYAVDGVLVLMGNARSAFPVDAVRVRLDEGAWESLPQGEDLARGLAAFSTAGTFRRVLETRGLAAGPHTLAVEVSAGPFVRSPSTLTVDVADALASIGSHRLPESDRGTAWDVDRDHDGRVVIAYDRGVARLDEQGALELTFEPYDGPGRFDDVEATTQYVYALSSPLVVRYEAATGALDRSFGIDGALDLGVVLTGENALCYASQIAASDDALFVTDSCNARVLRLTPDGVLDGVVALGDGLGYANVQHPVLATDGLWVWRERHAGSDFVRELVSIDPTSLVVRTVVSLDARVTQSAGGVGVGDDAFWVVAYDGMLLQLDRDGALRAAWVGGDMYEPLVPGVINIGAHVEVFADGSAEVLSVQTASLERFAPTR
ncbi:carbohydrate-binding protein [Sandaracinus amylolyticus]|uniref:carbohydrate-binding protein n=1 Tax=Sandaracinus amylolyticus TaxID=927083 RepID=UPI001F3981F0|nr:carbohydrate-binding protein [Sandaracinus amylolyticus]UJR85140.1 Hypothetical protein I5071_72200 [Sandaracinus amylolyticus]